MIKKFCDRCGKEIVGEPWYMRWYQNTMSGLGMGAAMMYSNICSRADSVNSCSNAVSQPGAPMYCDECRMAILAFAAEKPEQEEVVVGVSDSEAIDALELVDRYCSGKECKKCVFLGELDECTIFDGDKYTLDEIVRLAREKLRKAHGGKK
jgi:hypothetical protein